ncbi:MAG TPA: sulfotransferase [Blastocatellia bacterium]|nr:sulfotransferase [Blastocatellia bacterium]
MIFFLILSSPRSGSTLLAQCLSSHSQVIIPNETDWIVPAAFVLDRVRDESAGRRLIAEIITRSQGFATNLGEYLLPAEVEHLIERSSYSLLAMAESLYGRIAEKVGKRLAGDKSPNDLMSLRHLFLHGLLTSKVIHLVRDGRDVCASLMRMKWVEGVENYFARQWNANNLYLSHLMRGAANYHFLRYEDFAAAPKSTLEKVCAFLGIRFEEQMLDTAGFHPRYRHRLPHEHLYRPIEPHSGEHCEHKGLVPLWESQAREALEFFGYLP